MKPKGLLIAVVLLAVLGGVTWWSNKSQADKAKAPAADAPAKLLTIPDDQFVGFPDLGEAPSVAVTRGERGCAVRIGNDRAECPGYTVKVVDTVGAGDAFAAAFLHGLAAEWSAAKTGDFANRLGALVASRAGAVPRWSPGELEVA